MEEWGHNGWRDERVSEEEERRAGGGVMGLGWRDEGGVEALRDPPPSKHRLALCDLHSVVLLLLFSCSFAPFVHFQLV